MDIRVLQYFLAVVREENITKAAQLLHITQPTLSRQLMGLEQELGVKLFSRNNHSVTLTEEGMLFRRRAEEIVTLSEDEAGIKAGGNADRRNFHRQRPSTTAPAIFPAFWRRFVPSTRT